MEGSSLLAVLHAAADAVGKALQSLSDWGPTGNKPGEYHSDLVADAAALEVLVGEGLGVLSEESGLHHDDRPVLVVLDPVDGSTNAARGVPWYATSLAALDADGPVAAVVTNLATGSRYEAVRDGGARCDGAPIRSSSCTELGEAIIGLSGHPTHHFGWKQLRILGAAALDLCAVASGILDAYADTKANSHSPWDYLGGLLVCQEAGAVVVDAGGRDLVARRAEELRAPIAAGTPELLAALIDARGEDGS